MSDEMDEIWALFADDGGQSLDALEEALMELEAGDDDPDPHIAALFRAVHTFKGNSRVLGLSTVESRAHLAEDLIGLVRDDGVPLDEEILSVMFRAGDTLRTMLEETAASRADVDPGPSEELMDILRSTIARCKESIGKADSDAPADAGQAPEEVQEPEPEPEAAAAEVDETPEAPEPENEPQEEEAVAEPEPEAPSEPEPEAKDDEASKVEEADEANKPKKRKIDDPGYQSIFTKMVNETIDKFEALKGDGDLDAAELAQKAAKLAGNLSYAAKQLELSDWVTELNAFKKKYKDGAETTDVVHTSIGELTGSLKAKLDAGFGGEEPTPEKADEGASDAGEEKADEGAADVGEEKADEGAADAGEEKPKQKRRKIEDIDQEELDHFPERMKNIHDKVSDIGERVTRGEQIDDSEPQQVAEQITEFAESFGFVRVTEVAKLLGNVQSSENYKAAELRFYEELVAIEGSIPVENYPNQIAPSVMLGIWCTTQSTQSVEELKDTLDQFKTSSDLKFLFGRFDRVMRMITHAAHHLDVEIAAQVAMSLLDLFTRDRQAETKPKAVILALAATFAEETGAILTAAEKGDPYNLAPLERLSDDSANAVYVANGTVDAKSIEKRLGLPKLFKGVLSPDSVIAALSAIERDLSFYILRSDLNKNADVAQKFFDWINSDEVEMITNVTVFHGDETLFDFLVAVELRNPVLMALIDDMDSTGKLLHVTHTLEVAEEVITAAPKTAEQQTAEILAGTGKNTMEVVEAIGEISAGQAMVQHLLSELSSRDLMMEIDSALRDSGVMALEPQVRSAIRDTVDQYTTGIQNASEQEAQLTEQLAQLQQQSVEMRCHPAEVLLKPLGQFIDKAARGAGLDARLTTTGGEVVLDRALIESLQKIFKALFNERLKMVNPPKEYHLTIQSESDRINAIMQDNGHMFSEKSSVQTIENLVKEANGDFRHAEVPGQGTRFHISLPLHMIVMDGMVVRVQDVNYVIPIDSILRILQGDRKSILGISAGHGQKMLEVGKEEHVPIHKLSGSVSKNGISVDANADNNRIYVIVRNRKQQVAIPVDELMGQQLVLLRPLRGVMSQMRDLTGVALLAGGEVGMVLAVNRLLAA